MTKKDYQLIAGVFNKRVLFMENESADVTDEIISTASQLADALLKDNPRFDVDKFMNAVVKGSSHD